MIDIEVEKLNEVQNALKETPNKVNLVLSRAVNRATANAKSNISKKVRERYIVKASDIKKTIETTKATTQKPFATVKSTGKKLDMIDFKLSPNALFKGQSGYRVQILKSGGYKAVPGFAAESTKWGLFIRQGKDRYPWRRLMGPAVPEMIENKNVIDWVENEAKLMLNKRVDHELQQVLGEKNK